MTEEEDVTTLYFNTYSAYVIDLHVLTTAYARLHQINSHYASSLQKLNSFLETHTPTHLHEHFSALQQYISDSKNNVEKFKSVVKKNYNEHISEAYQHTKSLQKIRKRCSVINQTLLRSKEQYLNASQTTSIAELEVKRTIKDRGSNSAELESVENDLKIQQKNLTEEERLYKEQIEIANKQMQYAAHQLKYVFSADPPDVAYIEVTNQWNTFALHNKKYKIIDTNTNILGNIPQFTFEKPDFSVNHEPELVGTDGIDFRNANPEMIAPYINKLFTQEQPEKQTLIYIRKCMFHASKTNSQTKEFSKTGLREFIQKQLEKPHNDEIAFEYLWILLLLVYFDAEQGQELLNDKTTMLYVAKYMTTPKLPLLQKAVTLTMNLAVTQPANEYFKLSETTPTLISLTFSSTPNISHRAIFALSYVTPQLTQTSYFKPAIDCLRKHLFSSIPAVLRNVLQCLASTFAECNYKSYFDDNDITRIIALLAAEEKVQIYAASLLCNFAYHLKTRNENDFFLQKQRIATPITCYINNYVNNVQNTSIQVEQMVLTLHNFFVKFFVEANDQLFVTEGVVSAIVLLSTIDITKYERARSVVANAMEFIYIIFKFRFGVNPLMDEIIRNINATLRLDIMLDPEYENSPRIVDNGLTSLMNLIESRDASPVIRSFYLRHVDTLLKPETKHSLEAIAHDKPIAAVVLEHIHSLNDG
ncbi:hypothetical protein QTN25_004141 [Entamoeba marina]